MRELLWNNAIVDSTFVYMFPLWGLLVVMVLSLYFYAIRGCSVSTSGGSPLDLSLADWPMYSYHPMSKKDLVF